MVTLTTFGETRTVLENISWQTFKTMLAEMGSERKNRIAYDNKIVEIMTPLMPHDNSNRLIEVFVGVLCEEFGFEIKRTGSLTLTQDNLERGGEPDSSYYIQNEPLVRDKENIDLATDPPPDLVLEVEYSKPKVDKAKIYAAMGVPEFWRYNGSILRIYVLTGSKYTETQASPTFAGVAVREIPKFIQQAKQNGEISTTRNFRVWVREQIAKLER